jgi:hypothetical protein
MAIEREKSAAKAPVLPVTARATIEAIVPAKHMLPLPDRATRLKSQPTPGQRAQTVRYTVLGIRHFHLCSEKKMQQYRPHDAPGIPG